MNIQRFKVMETCLFYFLRLGKLFARQTRSFGCETNKISLLSRSRCIHFAANCSRFENFPFTVFLEGIEVDDVFNTGQIHFQGVVRPRSEHDGATLLVEWIIGYVDLTNGLEHPSRFPVDFSVVFYDGSELAKLLVDVFCSERKLMSEEL